jgi:hypothetical protein
MVSWDSAEDCNQNLGGSFYLSAAYNLTVNYDVHTIGTDPKCAGVQIVDVLTTIKKGGGFHSLAASFVTFSLNWVFNR